MADERDRPLAEMADRLRAGYNRWLKRHTLAERAALHDQCVQFDPKPLLATPIESARFVVIDTETTGLAAYAGAELVQIALLEYQGLQPTGREINQLIRPQAPIPAASTAIHGIDDDMVREAPSAEEVIDGVVEFIGEAVLVGHHVAFDLRFLNRVMHRCLYCRLPQPTLDTMLMYLAYSGRLGQYDLETVARACGVEAEQRHDARADAAASGGIVRYLAPRLTAPSRSVGELIAATRAPPAVDGSDQQPAL